MSQDPRQKHPKPPYPSQQQEPPGLESEMDPMPDYGEESYKGSGKLRERRRSLPAATAASVVPWHWPSPARGPTSLSPI